MHGIDFGQMSPKGPPSFHVDPTHGVDFGALFDEVDILGFVATILHIGGQGVTNNNRVRSNQNRVRNVNQGVTKGWT